MVKEATLYSAKAKELILKALKVLGKKNLSLIVHGNSFPSVVGKNPGMGTPNSQGGRNLIDFISEMFNSIQLGPGGKTKDTCSSPYGATVFSDNPLFIDLEQLSEEKWNKILPSEVFKKICDENPARHTNKTAYDYIFKAHSEAMKTAYSNFIQQASGKLHKDFEKFKKVNSSWLEKDSLYEALITEHGNDYWPNWESDTDKNLFNSDYGLDVALVNSRIAELKEKYAELIDEYSFSQFVISLQNKETKQYAAQRGIKLIADRQVAFSDRDIWAYQHFFLKGWFLGCPPDYFSKEGQSWGFPTMNPEKLFNKDGSLGPAGILMKDLYKKIFTENTGGVRIDHTIGLIDPWVYKEGKKPLVEDGAGRLYSSPQNRDLSRYSIIGMKDIDQEYGEDEEKWVKKLSKSQLDKYSVFMEKIIISAAKETGLNTDAIICEDLGSTTYPVLSVMKKTDLQGMRILPFVDPKLPEHPYRAKNIPKRCWVMVGTHDNQPISMWSESIVFTHEAYLHAVNLTEDLWPDIDQIERESIIVRLTKDAKFLSLVKLIEMFACKAENVQIFFSDLFGLQEVYNLPGSCGDANWSLRIPDNFIEVYNANLDCGLSINLLLVLKLALEARGDKFASKNQKLIDEMEKLLD